MELNNYRSLTPIKKKRKKITASAALVLCLLCLLIGILCGRAISSNKQSQEAAEKIAEIEHQLEKEVTDREKYVETHVDEINRLKRELADAKKALSEAQNVEEQVSDAPADEEDEPAAKKEKEKPAEKKKASNGFMRTLLIIILVIVIIVCLLFATSLFLKKGEDDEEDEEDEEYEEDIDEYEDEEDEEDEE